MDLRNMLRQIKKYHGLLLEHCTTNEREIDTILTCESDYKKGNTPPADKFAPLGADHVWGTGNDTHAWFRFCIPALGPDGYLQIKTDKKGFSLNSPQFLVYVDGQMRQGVDRNHSFVAIDDGAAHEITVYAYTGQNRASAEFYVTVGEWIPAVRDLYFDILYPLQLLDCLNDESSEYAEIVKHLYTALSMLDLLDEDEFLPSAKRAAAYMNDEFYGKYCRAQNSTVACIGHTHIDCAWKWTLAQTREKVQRSFSTVLELMRRYPEYKFMSSQPLLYSFMKEEAPELYAQIAEKVKQGSWEPEGAMWVEPDCNLISGESLVRQLLHGKEFFQNEFGVDSHILWLPDVFGYSAALPQILRKSGVDWFVTSKISWNDTNRMPYDTFLWKGIDGTAINSYFLTAQDDDGSPSINHTTYNGMATAQMIAGTRKRYQQKYLNDENLLAFGFGDGGGGATVTHLETLRRSAKGVPGSPVTKQKFVGEFLAELESKIADNPLLPTWQGELYLEFHRGTYTTMAKNKRFNRKAEFLYHNAELWSVLSNRLLGNPIPQAELHHGWQQILTNQFHDIIPGSSIKEVYDQSERDYAEVFSIGQAARNTALTAMAAQIEQDKGWIVFNPNSFEANGPVQVNGQTVFTKYPVPPLGYAVVRDFDNQNYVKIDGNTVETTKYTVTFDAHWQIERIYDKANDREVLTDGAKGNELRIYADYPDTYDAWEWQEYSRQSYKTITAVSDVQTVEDGARRGIKITRPYHNSVITQTVWFYDTLSQIVFDTKIDWHEQHKMLKTAFPVDVNADHATYEIQFGNVTRPTHTNTSWDAAKFEVCAHKYADYSDSGYGVGLINDCKYGYDIHDGVMQLSLLRSPTFPNPKADQGEIEFVYALCPHKGGFVESKLIRQAYQLNNTLTALPAAGQQTTIPTSLSLVQADAKNVLCETVKPSEDGEGYVLRLYETVNCRTKAKISLGFGCRQAILCDMMENELSPIDVKNNSFTLDFKGYEIITIKIK